MIDLVAILLKDRIDRLGYETIYTEKPIPDIIDFEWKNILQPPPDNISKTTAKELRYIASQTSNRSQKDIELIYSIDQDIDTPFILLLQKYSLEYPQQFINLFYAIIKPLIYNTKQYWNRARPFQLAKYYDINIDLINTDTIKTPSYPSGHTVYSSLVANIIKKIYPQVNQKELDNIVDMTAKARIMQGVHYPSDNNASLIFSKFLFNKLYPKLRNEYNDSL